ncbi:fibronectin type III domain-containing protein [Kordia sp.]|uniref:fibronectin type III domain-containing protein n=1 Tax=Kordia sp. TaxID=1965332 RepID=UPI0025C2A24F|nr:fibronectin type III domain-containing protein [Kordia sp.]MCH2197015.1 fibronectin type III domain-containing protein [Kordia sp.]
MKKYIYSIFTALLFISCSDIIEVPDISKDTVNLAAPSDNATLNITTLTLSWEAVEDAENYQVRVARPDFENILQVELDTTLTENSISVQLEAGNSYQWRVRAINSEYTTPYTTYTFTLEE